MSTLASVAPVARKSARLRSKQAAAAADAASSDSPFPPLPTAAAATASPIEDTVAAPVVSKKEKKNTKAAKKVEIEIAVPLAADNHDEAPADSDVSSYESEGNGDDDDLAEMLASKLDSPVSAGRRGSVKAPHVGASSAKGSRRALRRTTLAQAQVTAYNTNKSKRTTAAAAASSTTASSSAVRRVRASLARTTARSKREGVRKAKEMLGRLNNPLGLELEPNQVIETNTYWFGEPLPLTEAIAACVRTAPTVAAHAEERCAVCMEEFLSADPEVREYYANQRVVQLGKCAARHPFHSDCISAALTANPRCPVCMIPMAAACGTQPDGHMVLERIDSRLPGESCDTVVVSYDFPSGRQGPRHPSPGSHYHGTGRTAYFPYSPRGRVVLQQLMRAWDARVLFTVGTSVTTGMSDCVVWNGVHHKTNMSGGPIHYGYPDATYLDRVSEEMASVGVL